MSFEPIAIIGRACVLPGALSPQELWELVLAGKDVLGSAPAGRDAELRRVFSLRYAAMDLHSGLAERELDHVLVGTLAGEVAPDPNEIDELCWVDCEQLVQDVGDRPERYTPWFRLMLERLPELKTAAET